MSTPHGVSCARDFRPGERSVRFEGQHVRARYFADEGHVMFFSRIEEILGELVA
jgi:hypothetical protein